MSNKTCFKCGIEKPLDDFYKHPRMADGHLNKCKACTKKDVNDRRYNPKFRDYVLAYDRARGNRQSPEYRRMYTLEHKDELREKRKAYYSEHKDELYEKIADYRKYSPEKYRARNIVGNAIRDGKLDKGCACQKCGSTNKLHAHHEDYSKPLDVTWLCAPCHGKQHRKYV